MPRTRHTLCQPEHSEGSSQSFLSHTQNAPPSRVILTPAPGFTLKPVSAWAADHLVPGSAIFPDRSAYFGVVTASGCTHHPTGMAGQKLMVAPEFRWIVTCLVKLKSSLSGCHHTVDYRKYAAHYLAAFCSRLIRHFNLHSLQQCLLIPTASTTAKPHARCRLLTFMGISSNSYGNFCG